jgi:positive regulator of sigma E activity
VLKSAAQRSALVLGSSPDGLQFRLLDSAGCGSCQQACGSNIQQENSPPGRVIALDLQHSPLLDALATGQTQGAVQLGLKSGSLGQLAAACYLTHSLAMFIGAYLAVLVTAGGDLAAVIGAGLGLLLGCLGLSLYDSRGGGHRWLARVSMVASHKDSKPGSSS